MCQSLCLVWSGHGWAGGQGHQTHMCDLLSLWLWHAPALWPLLGWPVPSLEGGRSCVCHHSSLWNWQCPVKAQGSVWALLTRAEFSPVTWPQEYPITESFSHLITQLWLQQGCKVKCSLGLVTLCFSKLGCPGHRLALTGSSSLAVRSVDVGFHLCWCLVQWSDITDPG